MAFLGDLGRLVGRVMLVAIYAVSGWGKLTGFAGTVGYVASLGAPLPTLAAIVAIVVELGAAILIVVGFQTRLAALALVVFTAAATWFAHLYWTFPPEQQLVQSLMFWKNVGLAGGRLVLAAAGPGRLSIDGAGRR